MGYCKWCDELVEGPEVRPGLIVSESLAPVGVSVVRRAHWLGTQTEKLQKTDKKADEGIEILQSIGAD